LNGETWRIVELRRYALRPRARDTLIELFDRELVEPQEQLGMRLLGQFRDLDDPDGFVWLRGFSDMQFRKRALEAFYGGPVWKTHASAANATMIDVDNVLLLRPLAGLRRRRSPTAREHGPSTWPARGHDLSARRAHGRRLPGVLHA
jgi:NIPSNAP protein